MENFLSEYEIVSDITEDKFSIEYIKSQNIKILEVKHKATGELYNDIIFDLSKEEVKNVINLKDQLDVFPEIMSQFQEEGKFHIITENLSNFQSLYVFFIKNPTLITEKKIATIFKQICISLKKLHDTNLILNNFSLDNIFYYDNDDIRKIIFINLFNLEESNIFTNDIKKLGEILQKMKNIRGNNFRLLKIDELKSSTKLLNQIETNTNITINDIIKSDYLNPEKQIFTKKKKSLIIQSDKISDLVTSFNQSYLDVIDDSSSCEDEISSSRTLNTNNDKFINKVLKDCCKATKKIKFISFNTNNESKHKKKSKSLGKKKILNFPSSVKRQEQQQIETNIKKKPLEAIISESQSMTLFDEALATTAKYSLPTKRAKIHNPQRSIWDTFKGIFN